MDRTFEATFDEQGHFDMPADFRERHGFTPGSKVKVEEQGLSIVIEPINRNSEVDSSSIEEKKRIMRGAIEKAAGFSGNSDAPLKTLLEERKRF